MGMFLPAPQDLLRKTEQLVSNGYILFLYSVSGSIITFIDGKSIEQELNTENDNNWENNVLYYVNYIIWKMSNHEAIDHNLPLYVTIGNKTRQATER